MGIKVQDYILEINKRKKEAFENGFIDLTIRAGDLHSDCGTKGSPTLIQCCSAMRQCMLEGDEIVFTKENKSGVSAALTIKYNVTDIANRKSINSVKKRGRPPRKSNMLTEPKEKCFDVQDVNHCIENWIRKEKMRYETSENNYIIKDSYGLWLVPKYTEKSHAENFLELLKQLNEDHYKCSIIFKDTKETHLFWNSISEAVKEKLNMSAFFVAENKEVYQEIC